MFYRNDDIADAMEAKSHLQLEAWPSACEALASMPNLQKMKILIGNARYLGDEYVLCRPKKHLYEVVLRFLERCRTASRMEVVIVSKCAVRDDTKKLMFLGLDDGEIVRMEAALKGHGMGCQIRSDLQRMAHINLERY